MRSQLSLPVSILLAVAWSVLADAPVPASSPAFHPDDPLLREPETQDASPAREWTIDLFVDVAINLFGRPGDDRANVAAANVNSIDEVPDSGWFTNRLGMHPVSIDEAVRAGHGGNGPAPGTWTVVGAKEIGAAPGFIVKDAAGETWFISFDARGYPEAATGAILVANRIFWTLGYWQADNVLVRVQPDQILLGDSATVRPMSGKTRRMRKTDLEAVWARAHRSPDGSFRAVAARRLPGRALGGFRYYDTRPDDPNDVIPHEHRRELRALHVFGGWTNLVDIKAGNTLDMMVTEGGRGVVRHYLQDVGSTFGTGATAPREYFEGWEHLYEGDLVWKRLVSLGFFLRPWQTIQYEESVAIGRFESTAFDPRAWKPRVPVAALRHAQPEDLFWAARRVAAFSDVMIRALVHAGQYSAARDEQQLADTLIARRDKIAATYLVSVNPLVDFALARDDRLSFVDAAVTAGVAPAPRRGYHVSWAAFDNATGGAIPIGDSTSAAGERLAAPAALPHTPGAFVRVRVTPLQDDGVPRPIDAYFRYASDGWTLVGLNRRGITS